MDEKKTSTTVKSSTETNNELRMTTVTPAVSVKYDGENYPAWKLEVEFAIQDLGFKKTRR